MCNFSIVFFWIGSGERSNCYWVLSWRLWGASFNAYEKKRCSFWFGGEGMDYAFAIELIGFPNIYLNKSVLREILIWKQGSTVFWNGLHEFVIYLWSIINWVIKRNYLLYFLTGVFNLGRGRGPLNDNKIPICECIKRTSCELLFRLSFIEHGFCFWTWWYLLICLSYFLWMIVVLLVCSRAHLYTVS